MNKNHDTRNESEFERLQQLHRRGKLQRKLVFGFTIASVMFAIYVADQVMRKKMLQSFVSENDLKTNTIHDVLQFKLTQVYQGLRTISRLPSVRGISRYGGNLDVNSKLAIQEIYNNLAENVNFSEVYIVPAEFEPDQMDRHTGKLETPIVTFDEVILGKTGYVNDGHSNSDQGPKIEEVEIYEYRKMKEQSARFRSMYQQSISDTLDVAMLVDPVSITCDNSRYNPSKPNDKDREGLLLSVPFFSDKGEFKGLISGIILTSVFADFLPAGDFGLVAPQIQFTIPGRQMDVHDSDLKMTGINETSKQYFEMGMVDPSLIYSRVLPLAMYDKDSKWFLWAGRSNDRFANSVSIRNLNVAEGILFVLLTVILSLIFYLFELNATKSIQDQCRKFELEGIVNEKIGIISIQQAKMAENARLTSLGEMAASIAHEVNNPIAVINGNTELLIDSIDSGTMDPIQFKKSVDKISVMCARISKIVSSLLAFSRRGTGEAKKVECINSIIHESIDLIKHKASTSGVPVTCQLDENRFVYCDSVQLSQVIVNLISNSVDAVKGNEFAWVKVKFIDDTEKKDIIISVSDSGQGIDPETANNMMQPFFTTKGIGKGTGLGLSISAGIINDHGGELSYNPKSLNTEFLIRLPLAAAEQLPKARESNRWTA